MIFFNLRFHTNNIAKQYNLSINMQAAAMMLTAIMFLKHTHRTI